MEGQRILRGATALVAGCTALIVLGVEGDSPRDALENNAPAAEFRILPQEEPRQIFNGFEVGLMIAGTAGVLYGATELSRGYRNSLTIKKIY